MKIIIVGIGKLGEYLTKLLAKENNEITVVDINFNGNEDIINNEDINYVRGNGLDSNVLIEAGAQESDLLISAMELDSENIICALIAKKLGTKNTIARIRAPEYNNSINYISETLGLSMSINPEKLAATHIFQSLSIPNALDATSFFGGKMYVVKIKIKEHSPFKDLSIEQISKIVNNKTIICAIERDGEIIIPNGSTKIYENDKMHIIGNRKDILYFLNIGKFVKNKTKDVIIIGGSNIAIYLAKMLVDTGMNVKLIEDNKDRCKLLSEKLDDVLIINGDASDEKILYEEGIEDCDAIVSLSNIDEENIVYSMFASIVGVPKIITKINHINLKGVAKKACIDTIITPHKIAANQVVQYVRAIENSQSSPCESIYKFGDDIFEVIEFKVKSNFIELHKKIKDIQFKQDLLIGVIQRGDSIFCPTGDDEIKLKDRILVICKNPDGKIRELNDVVK